MELNNFHDREYLVHRSNDFDGTAYVELVPGVYEGKHWQPGSIFIDDIDFSVIEGLILKHLPDYDHFAMNDVPQKAGIAIIREWQRAAAELSDGMKSASEVLCLSEKSVFRFKPSELEDDRNKIANMLEEIAATCNEFIRDKSCFCVLGL
jgi:hypothetical protein